MFVWYQIMWGTIYDKMIIVQMSRTMEIFVPGQKYKAQNKNIGIIKPILMCTAIYICVQLIT